MEKINIEEKGTKAKIMKNLNKIAVVDFNITKEEMENLSEYGITIIQSDEVNVLLGLKGHPDLQIFKLKNKIFTHNDISDRFYNELIENIKNKNLEIELVKTDTVLSKKYPFDVPFNITYSDNYILHNFKYTNKEVLSFIKEDMLDSKFEMINLKQGYSRCTTVNIVEDLFLTSDEGIYKTLIERKIECILFNSRDTILLDKFDVGFIGGTGATVLFNNTIMFFTFGNINNHENGNEIILEIARIVKNKGYDFEYIPLSNSKLTDKGSIIFI